MWVHHFRIDSSCGVPKSESELIFMIYVEFLIGFTKYIYQQWKNSSKKKVLRRGSRSPSQLKRRRKTERKGETLLGSRRWKRGGRSRLRSWGSQNHRSNKVWLQLRLLLNRSVSLIAKLTKRRSSTKSREEKSTLILIQSMLSWSETNKFSKW